MKYKLIKEYPGSPKLGSICNFGDNLMQDGIQYRIELAKEFPEFWEPIVELKSPLFTTEDEVDIFEGDKIWLIEKETFTNFEDAARKRYIEQNIYGEVKFTDYLKFSTLEAADNYIKCNKPCLSFNDVWNLTSNKSSDNNYLLVSKKDLKTLVKSKLTL